MIEFLKFKFEFAVLWLTELIEDANRILCFASCYQYDSSHGKELSHSRLLGACIIGQAPTITHQYFKLAYF